MAIYWTCPEDDLTPAVCGFQRGRTFNDLGGAAELWRIHLGELEDCDALPACRCLIVREHEGGEKRIVCFDERGQHRTDEASFDRWFHREWKNLFGVPTPPRLVEVKTRLWLAIRERELAILGRKR